MSSKQRQSNWLKQKLENDAINNLPYEIRDEVMWAAREYMLSTKTPRWGIPTETYEMTFKDYKTGETSRKEMFMSQYLADLVRPVWTIMETADEEQTKWIKALWRAVINGGNYKENI